MFTLQIYQRRRRLPQQPKNKRRTTAGVLAMRYHCDYQPTLLNSTPEVLHIGPWRLHYLAFSQHATDSRTPVLLLGGAFQSFRSFASEVGELLNQHPVILLDLPSQGGNLQLAPELSLAQLADLIAAFIKELQLPAVMPIGRACYCRASLRWRVPAPDAYCKKAWTCWPTIRPVPLPKAP